VEPKEGFFLTADLSMTRPIPGLNAEKSLKEEADWTAGRISNYIELKNNL
jgi:hypothetical protein